MYKVRDGNVVHFESERGLGTNGVDDIAVKVPADSDLTFFRRMNETIVQNKNDGNITVIANRDVPPPPTTLV